MTLRTLLHELRRDLSQRYMRKDLINETAFLLGCSRPAPSTARSGGGRAPPSAYRQDRTSSSVMN